MPTIVMMEVALRHYPHLYLHLHLLVLHRLRHPRHRHLRHCLLRSAPRLAFGSEDVAAPQPTSTPSSALVHPVADQVADSSCAGEVRQDRASHACAFSLHVLPQCFLESKHQRQDLVARDQLEHLTIHRAAVCVSLAPCRHPPSMVPALLMATVTTQAVMAMAAMVTEMVTTLMLLMQTAATLAEMLTMVLPQQQCRRQYHLVAMVRLVPLIAVQLVLAEQSATVLVLQALQALLVLLIPWYYQLAKAPATVLRSLLVWDLLADQFLE